MSVEMRGDFGDGVIRRLDRVPEEWLELPEKDRNTLILKRILQGDRRGKRTVREKECK